MSKHLPLLVLIAAVAFATSPFFFEPFSGFNPDDLPSDPGILPVQPAGYAFAIWGVIYLWLIVGSAFGLLKRATAEAWAPMRPVLLLSLVIGAAWIPIALIAPVSSTVLIIAMLVTALSALIKSPQSDQVFGSAPIGLYAGWLSAASVVASTTIAAAYTSIDGQILSYIGLLAIALIAGTVLRITHQPLAYGAAVIWALVGVIVANLDGGITPITGAATGLIVALAYLVIQRLRALA